MNKVQTKGVIRSSVLIHIHIRYIYGTRLAIALLDGCRAAEGLTGIPSRAQAMAQTSRRLRSFASGGWTRERHAGGAVDTLFC